MRKIILAFMLLSLPAHAEKRNTQTVGGRFQMIQLSDMRRDQFLIDTETGRLWQKTCALEAEGGNGADCSVSYWAEESVEGKNTTSQKIDSLVGTIQKRREAKKNGAEFDWKNQPIIK